MTLLFCIGLLLTSVFMISIGYALVLLWNWVPETPPTKLPLPPSLDYIHFISCKILGAYVLTMVLAISPMPAVGMYAFFEDVWSFLRKIWRVVLVCVASTSRSLIAIAIAITAWGSMLNLFRPVGQAASSALVRVGFIPLIQIAAESLSESIFAQRIYRLCE